MLEVKDCPCCGNEATLVMCSDKNRGEVYSAQCTHCLVETEFYDNKQIALDDWNRRSDLLSSGIFVRVCRDGEWKNLDIFQLTAKEMMDFVKDRSMEEGWRWFLALWNTVTEKERIEN